MPKPNNARFPHTEVSKYRNRFHYALWLAEVKRHCGILENEFEDISEFTNLEAAYSQGLTAGEAYREGYRVTYGCDPHG